MYRQFNIYKDVGANSWVVEILALEEWIRLGAYGSYKIAREAAESAIYL